MYPIYKIENNAGKFSGNLVSSPEQLSNNIAVLQIGEYAVEWEVDVYPETQYYDLANSILMRPEITAMIDKTTIAADGMDSVNITGLPVPCNITIDGTTTEDTDGELEFSVTQPGTYIIKIESFPYQETEFTVVAT